MMDIRMVIIYNIKHKVIIMKKIVISNETDDILKKLGYQIKLFRLRRDISMELVCERANISRTTYWQIEKGSPNVAIGYYAAALHALGGQDKDLLKICGDDSLGRLLQDGKLVKRNRASSKR